MFDPLGLLSPVTITMKSHFHSLCLDKLDWDVELQGNHQRLWKNFESSLFQLSTSLLRVPRCYFTSPSTPTDIQIYACSDASKKAYAVAIYLRIEYEDGSVEVKFLPSKTRVLPIKQQVIPRSKLPGALIATRRVSSLLKSLPREIKPTFWVDSTTILCWNLHTSSKREFIPASVSSIFK